MGILITILTAAVLFLLMFWAYGFYLHTLKEECEIWKALLAQEVSDSREEIQELENQLNQVPRSVRDYYSKK